MTSPFDRLRVRMRFECLNRCNPASAAFSTSFAGAVRSARADVDAALAEVRTALIEADVALPVVTDFIGKVRPRAIGENVIRSVTPGQQVVKIVHDVLVETLGADNAALSLGSPPAPILMVGLQGSGKTTTSAKLGLMLQTREKKRVLMASLDVNRPAAMEQLRRAGRAGGCRHASHRRGPGSRRHRQARARLRQGGRLRRSHSRHRRPPVDRRAADGGSGQHQGRDQSARDPAGRRQPDRPGRGQYRQELQRPAASVGHHPDAGRWRCPRRRGAFHAQRHRRADQVPRRRRKAGRAGSLPSRTRRLAHPRHGRCGVPGREGGRDNRQAKGREARRQDEERSVRHERPGFDSCAR